MKAMPVDAHIMNSSENLVYSIMNFLSYLILELKVCFIFYDDAGILLKYDGNFAKYISILLLDILLCKLATQHFH